MYEINKSNYYVLRRILKNNPVFVKTDSFYSPPCGQVYLHLYPNTIGHRSLRVIGLNGGSASPHLGCMPLTYNGKLVILNDQYSIDLFDYQYGFFFSDAEEYLFHDHVFATHPISLKRLKILRDEGINVCDMIRNAK